MPSEVPINDCYETLGVPRDAGDSEIRAAYIKLVKLSHADRLGTSPDPSACKASNDRLAQFNGAFFVLGDPVRRKQYDESPAATTESGVQPEAEKAPLEKMFMIVAGGSMPERNVVIKALLNDKVITSYHSYITTCILCTSKLTATDISNCIVKHFGMKGNPVFLVTETSGEIKGRLSMGAWEFIKKSTPASTRGWKQRGNAVRNAACTVCIGTRRGRTWIYRRDKDGWPQTEPTGRLRRMTAEQFLSHLLPPLAGVSRAVVRVEPGRARQKRGSRTRRVNGAASGPAFPATARTHFRVT